MFVRGKTIEIDPKVIDEVKNHADEMNMSARKYVETVLKTSLAKDELRTKLFPNFGYLGIQNKKLMIRDGSSIADIVFKNNSLYCELDKKNDCDHIHFALTTVEIGKLN